MSPLEHGEVFVLNDGGEAGAWIWPVHVVGEVP